MEIHSIGYHHYHDKDFVIDRPDGIGQSWLFLVFKTRTIVRQNGVDTVVLPDSCIIYSGDEPEYYKADDETYIDDWFHFTVEELDIQLFRELALPINKVIYLGNAYEISSIIRTMTFEHYSSNIYSADVVELNMKILFFRLARLIHSDIRLLSENSHSKYDLFLHIRNRIYNQISSIGSVTDLAKQFSMSISDFQHTYKKIFNTSVTEDIRISRLTHAKNLLTTTNLPLKHISQQIGYKNEYNFMRHFKKHIGMTPTEYRKKTL